MAGQILGIFAEGTGESIYRDSRQARESDPQ